jgi:hypothetical protein
MVHNSLMGRHDANEEPSRQEQAVGSTRTRLMASIKRVPYHLLDAPPIARHPTTERPRACIHSHYLITPAMSYVLDNDEITSVLF